MDIRTMTQKPTAFRCPPPPYSSKGFRAFWRGFTLAEVLITLTIIGIIAALTVPTLMNKVQDHGFRSAFLKAYQVVQNAHKMANRDGVNFWDKGDISFSQMLWDDPNLIKNYFKVAKDIKLGEAGYPGSAWLGYFYSGKYSLITNYVKYLNNENSHWAFFKDMTSLTFQTADGMIIAFCLFSYHTNMIYVDVNGPNKPNIVGRDIFFLQSRFNSNDGSFSVYPWGSPYTSQADGIKVDDCYKNSYGTTCGYHILKNRSFVIPDKKPE